MTLLMWQTCRERRWPYWVPLLIPIIFAAFTKESGLMIPLMIVAIHWGRARWLREPVFPGQSLILARGSVSFWR